MGNLIKKAKDLISFYSKANTSSDIVNENLSELAYMLLDDKTNSCSIKQIEGLRKTLQKDRRILQIQDLGAGSTYSKSNERTVKSIAKSALSPKWQCEILTGLAREFQTETILELGTSLGISTAYLANANFYSTVYTLEGSQSISRVAMETFAKLGLKNIKMILGDFDITLPTLLRNIKEIDFAFIDGNHKKDSTINYFEQILPLSHKNTVFVFDDINWSNGMKEAWEIIKLNPKTKASLDFYSFGVVLLNERFDGHYKLIKNSFKPI